MAENKTQPTDQSVDQFIAGVEPPARRDDAVRLMALMRDVTGEEPQMWGPSIVGFGHQHYHYESGREGDTMKVGFSPRKAQMSLYGLQDHPDAPVLLGQLGPHTTGAGCVYVKKLDQVNEDALRRLIDVAYREGGISR